MVLFEYSKMASVTLVMSYIAKWLLELCILSIFKPCLLANVQLGIRSTH